MSAKTSVECYQVLTEDGQFASKVLSAREIHALELPHLCVQVWAMTSTGKMLHVRRRPTYYAPGGWDPIAIYAHVRLGENPLETAMCSLQADLGWRVARIELRHFPVKGNRYSFHEDKFPGGQSLLHRTVCANYSLLLPEMIPSDLDRTFKLDSGSIGEVAFYPLARFAEDMPSPIVMARYGARSVQPELFEAAVEHLAQQRKAVR